MSYESNSVEERFNMSSESNSVEGRVPAVVGGEYVVQYKFVLNTAKKKWNSNWSSDFSIEDGNNNCVYRAHKSRGLSKTIQLRDTNDVPVLCLHKKAFSFKSWNIYSGSEPQDDALLFKWKRRRFKNKIYLAGNVAREKPDFTIKMNTWYGHNFKVLYHKEVIAEATQEGFKIERRPIFISAVPHVDQAFIAAILILMEEQFEDAAKNG